MKPYTLTPEQQERKLEALRASYQPQPVLPPAPYEDWAVVYAEDVGRLHCFTYDRPRRQSHNLRIIPRRQSP